MHYLAYLWVKFSQLKPVFTPFGNAKDLFISENFNILYKAVESYCNDEEKLKAGLKHGVQYAIISAVKTLRAVAYTENNDEDAKRFERFQSVFKLWEDTLFGDAAVKLKRASDTKLRKPAQLPVEEDMQKLQDQTKLLIQEFIKKPVPTNYIMARNAACARLALFNGRRGFEPSHLLITDFQEANNDTWIDKSYLENLDDVCWLIMVNKRR